MNQKVFGAVFVLAVALGIVSVSVRNQDDPGARSASPRAAAEAPLARPLASYRVTESGIVGGMDFQGVSYAAQVSERGFRFGSKDAQVFMGAPRVQQGTLSLECAGGTFSRPAFGVGQVDRGAVVEKYIFENGRAEQIFTLPAPISTGALTVRIPVTSTFGGPVVTHVPLSGKFEDAQFAQGGIAFCDAAGVTKLAYHGAVAIDAAGRQLALAPRHENGEIVLEVHGDFMSKAAYPLVIDPWLDLASSGIGGGVTQNSSVSSRPSVAVTGGGNPYIAWADTTSGNSDIYVKFWNGFQFLSLGISGNSGGISADAAESLNPSIVLTSEGEPIVAWESNGASNISIFVKQWNRDAESWDELGGSATSGGMSRTAGPARTPSVGVVRTQVPFPLANPQIVEVPVVAWQDQSFGSDILVRWFYPGDPGDPGDALLGIPAVPATPAAWLSLGGSAIISFQVSGRVSEAPSLTVDGRGRPCVAWHDTASDNFEIYVKRFDSDDVTVPTMPPPPPQFPAPPPGTSPALSTANLVMIRSTTAFWNTPGTWAGIGNSATTGTGGISATSAPSQTSQFPAIAADGVNLTVAWVEDVGSSKQIYVKRFDLVNLASPNFVEPVAGSASGTGISGQLVAGVNSTAPSVDVKGTPATLVVAWVDDRSLTGTPSQNTEIYVRRFTMGDAAWSQFGLVGSAAAYPAETPDAQGGISNTASLSLMPQVRLDNAANPIVVWMDGAKGSFDILLRAFSPNGPTDITGSATLTLRQTTADPMAGATSTDIFPGSTTPSSIIYLSGTLFSEILSPGANKLSLEVEVQPEGSPFSGKATGISSPVDAFLLSPPALPNTPAGNVASYRYSGVPNFNYKWRARTVDDLGRYSPWQSFNSSDLGIDFGVNSATVGGGGGGTGTPKNYGICGLLGLDGLLLVGALGLLRRRFRK